MNKGILAGFALSGALLAQGGAALAEPISLHCSFSAAAGGDFGNFSGESVYAILDLDGHSVVSGYDGVAGHHDETTSTLGEDSDRLTWTYSKQGWIVDYILDRSTLELHAAARGINIMGNTNTGIVTYACSKVQKQI